MVKIVGRDGSLWYDTHNILLTIWFCAGVGALLLWLALNVLLVTTLWRTRNATAVIALGLLIYGWITTFFEGSGLPGRPTEFWYQVWLPIALGLWAIERAANYSLTNSE